MVCVFLNILTIIEQKRKVLYTSDANKHKGERVTRAQIYKTIQNTSRRMTLVIAAITVTLVSVVAVLPAQQASALGCRHYDGEAWWWNYVPPAYPGDRDRYYGLSTTVPYSSQSGCNDINLRRSSVKQVATLEPTCATFRVRYYPPNGTSFSPEKTVCNDGGPEEVVLAYGVPGGRPYRVEATYYVRYHIYD